MNRVTGAVRGTACEEVLARSRRRRAYSTLHRRCFCATSRRREAKRPPAPMHAAEQAPLSTRATPTLPVERTFVVNTLLIDESAARGGRQERIANLAQDQKESPGVREAQEGQKEERVRKKTWDSGERQREGRSPPPAGRAAASSAEAHPSRAETAARRCARRAVRQAARRPLSILSLSLAIRTHSSYPLASYPHTHILSALTPTRAGSCMRQ